jgi:Uma2 family endonuclease
VNLCLGTYATATPGCEAGLDATLRLGELDQPQPDGLLWLLPEAGGRAHVDEDDYLTGAVELVVEVAVSSEAYDLHEKKTCYLRHGVREYIVVVTRSSEVVRFVHGDQGFDAEPADRLGVIRSDAFPGLWLDTRALLDRDSRRLLATLERGLRSKAHATFARELAARMRAAKRKRR